MSSRFLIPALCIGAIVLACGPRAHNEASTPSTTTPTVAQAGSPSPVIPVVTKRENRDKKPAIAAQLSVRADEASIRIALRVTNTSKKRVELTFPSGQTYDFVILDSLGREMWRWGNGRMFTQAVRNKLLTGGESIDLEETWKDAPLAPGRYTAKAVLASENYPLTEQAEFTVTTTTVASR